MSAILQFDKVEVEKIGQLSFTLQPGEIRQLHLASKDAKPMVADLILAEAVPGTGAILLQGKTPEAGEPGQTGIIQANGGLISNLKVWENITLPKWYHGQRLKRKTEESVAKWLKILLPDETDWERFMGSPVARLRNSERKLAGILRMLITAPELLLVDASIFDDVDDSKSTLWISALEQYVSENSNRAILALTHNSSRLPWKKIG